LKEIRQDRTTVASLLARRVFMLTNKGGRIAHCGSGEAGHSEALHYQPPVQH
jgi:hypothetical protein